MSGYLAAGWAAAKGAKLNNKLVARMDRDHADIQFPPTRLSIRHSGRSRSSAVWPPCALFRARSASPFRLPSRGDMKTDMMVGADRKTSHLCVFSGLYR